MSKAREHLSCCVSQQVAAMGTRPGLGGLLYVGADETVGAATPVCLTQEESKVLIFKSFPIIAEIRCFKGCSQNFLNRVFHKIMTYM